MLSTFYLVFSSNIAVFCQYNIYYYSTNSRDAHIWSESHCYPSSVRYRYPAIYVGCQDSYESCRVLHDHSFSRFKKRLVDNLLNNKTIILLNLVEYRLILANSAYIWPRRLSIRRYRRIGFVFCVASSHIEANRLVFTKRDMIYLFIYLFRATVQTR